ncbi:hypothetical protein Tco_1092052 [Tanacetum coccineum]|uniref:Uncharacterized protein n=1 Tax=Tanacetum coccineum TaxID=301880 RepID=A0ABQ5I8S0_9ASTR
MRIHGIAKVELASCEWGRSLRVMGLFDGAVVEVLALFLLSCCIVSPFGLTMPGKGFGHLKGLNGLRLIKP